MSTENTENNNLDITSSEDRQKFQQEKLYPALKMIYSGIMGSARTPIVVGSTAFYLHGIYIDKFPTDIDVVFDNYDDVLGYKMMFSGLCRKYGFKVDFLRSYIFDDDKNIITKTCGDTEIMISDIKTTYDILNKAYNFYKEPKPEKAEKYLTEINYLKEHYPQYFAENAEA